MPCKHRGQQNEGKYHVGKRYKHATGPILLVEIGPAGSYEDAQLETVLETDIPNAEIGEANIAQAVIERTNVADTLIEEASVTQAKVREPDIADAPVQGPKVTDTRAAITTAITRALRKGPGGEQGQAHQQAKHRCCTNFTHFSHRVSLFLFATSKRTRRSSDALCLSPSQDGGRKRPAMFLTNFPEAVWSITPLLFYSMPALKWLMPIPSCDGDASGSAEQGRAALFRKVAVETWQQSRFF